MAERLRSFRLEDELLAEAATNPALADADLSRLVRVGLALVAGYTLDAAVKMHQRKRPGPAKAVERERAGAAA